MTICLAWRPVLRDYLSCMALCPAWRLVLYHSLVLISVDVLHTDERVPGIQINWRTFHHDGKFSLAWRVGGLHALPFYSFYHHEQSCGAPAERTCDTFGGFIKGILRGVRCTKSLRVLFLHRRPPSWNTLVLYSRAVFIFNEPSFFSSVVLHMLTVLYSYCTYAHILTQ